MTVELIQLVALCISFFAFGFTSASLMRSFFDYRRMKRESEEAELMLMLQEKRCEAWNRFENDYKEMKR